MIRAGIVLLILSLAGCGFARGGPSPGAQVIPGPGGYTCFGISDGDHIVGGNCLKD